MTKLKQIRRFENNCYNPENAIHFRASLIMLIIDHLFEQTCKPSLVHRLIEMHVPSYAYILFIWLKNVSKSHVENSTQRHDIKVKNEQQLTKHYTTSKD